MHAGVGTLQFCRKDVITIPILTTWMVVKFHTLSIVWIVGPLPYNNIARYFEVRWVDGLVAWICIWNEVYIFSIYTN